MTSRRRFIGAAIVTAILLVCASCVIGINSFLWSSLKNTESELEVNPSDSLQKRMDWTIDKLVLLGEIRKKEFLFDVPVGEGQYRKIVHDFSHSHKDVFLHSNAEITSVDSGHKIENFTIWIESSSEAELISAMSLLGNVSESKR